MAPHVVWAPKAAWYNHFALWAPESKDVKLFEALQEADTGYARPHSKFVLRGTHAEGGVRCFEWSPSATNPALFAVGLASGRAVVANFETSHRQGVGPRYQRQCNCIAWHPSSPLLACGLDKARNDNCIVVWDVTRHLRDEPAPATATSGLASGLASMRLTPGQSDSHAPTMEPVWTKDADQCVSMAWVPTTPDVLACGFGVKYLKLHDTRVARFQLGISSVVTAHTRAVLGVKFDPNNGNHVATFGDDGFIKVWDLTMFHQPFAVINTGCKTLTSIEWCPSRTSLITSTSKDHGSVYLWYMYPQAETTAHDQQAPQTGLVSAGAGGGSSSSGAAAGAGSVDRSTAFQAVRSELGVCDAAWHPTSECSLLCVNAASVCHEVMVFPPSALSWDPLGHIVVTRFKATLTSQALAEADAAGAAAVTGVKGGPDSTGTFDDAATGSTLQCQRPPTPSEPCCCFRRCCISRTRKPSRLSCTTVMRRRALLGYGMDIDKNISVAAALGDATLEAMWSNVRHPLPVSFSLIVPTYL